MGFTIAHGGVPDLKKRRYRMRLNNKIKLAIKQHAKDEAPKECCGFILENGETYKARNVSNDENKFSIAIEDYVSADNLGEINAVYHSHPEQGLSFSEYDKFNSISHGIIYVLYSMRDNSFTQFDPSLAAFNKYIGREFKIGKTDCWALVRDFYESELNIKFRDYYRDEKYKPRLKEYFDSGMKTLGFYFVDELQKYDCILFGRKKDPAPYHIGLYLGDDLILHQPEKSYSRVEEYTNKHKRLTDCIIRHKEWKTIA